MDFLAGWKTYLVFGATLILAVAAKLGWAPADAGQVAQLVDFLTGPIFLSIIGIILRKITTEPAAV